MAKVTFSKDFKKVFEEIERNFKVEMKPLLKDVIIESISRGESPVEGHNRYDPYSKSYAKTIRKGMKGFPSKKGRPVNLKLSGKLHKSIKARDTRSGITVWFSDEKAEWHNKGMGLLPVRRLLPVAGEELSSSIQLDLEEKLEDIVKNTFR
jgi:hypothetical protein